MSGATRVARQSPDILLRNARHAPVSARSARHSVPAYRVLPRSRCPLSARGPPRAAVNAPVPRHAHADSHNSPCDSLAARETRRADARWQHDGHGQDFKHGGDRR
jgi:hypothetical protein